MKTHLCKTEYAEIEAKEESQQNISSGCGRLYCPKMVTTTFSTPHAPEELDHFPIIRWSLCSSP